MLPKLLYHISLKKNEKSIKLNGLLPKQPTDIREPIGVYLLKNFNDIEKQFKNRLKTLDKFDNNNPLILVTINASILSEDKMVKSPFGKIGSWILIYQDVIPQLAIMSIDNIKLSKI